MSFLLSLRLEYSNEQKKVLIDEVTTISSENELVETFQQTKFI